MNRCGSTSSLVSPLETMPFTAFDPAAPEGWPFPLLL